MTSTYDPCGTPESAGGCATCPLASECSGPSDGTLSVLEALPGLEERLLFLDAQDGFERDPFEPEPVSS